MKVKQSRKQRKTTGQIKPLVYYVQEDEKFIGTLSLIVHSKVDSKYDLAYIDFEKHWKVALLSEIKYL
jgi:hypothetical protein